jgi:hypothetical protein
MTAAIVLLVNGVFAFLVWPPFYRRTASDPRARGEQGEATRFLRVHQILIGTALILGVVSLVIGVLTLTGVTN